MKNRHVANDPGFLGLLPAAPFRGLLSMQAGQSRLGFATIRKAAREGKTSFICDSFLPGFCAAVADQRRVGKSPAETRKAREGVDREIIGPRPKGRRPASAFCTRA